MYDFQFGILHIITICLANTKTEKPCFFSLLLAKAIIMEQEETMTYANYLSLEANYFYFK